MAIRFTQPQTRTAARLVDTDAIRQEVERREIQALFHFTKVRSLGRIMQSGALLSRAELERQRCPSAYFTDPERLDGRTNTVSLTMGFPNYKMFFQKRVQLARGNHVWAVVVVHPKVLWEKPALFCPTNAASSSVRHTPDSKLCGITAFKACFSDGLARGGKRPLTLPANCPTNPQSEVLVQDRIGTDYLRGIAFFDDVSRLAWTRQYPALAAKTELAAIAPLFGSRIDSDHWRCAS